jgi:hypothetical protein
MMRVVAAFPVHHVHGKMTGHDLAGGRAQRVQVRLVHIGAHEEFRERLAIDFHRNPIARMRESDLRSQGQTEEQKK